MKIRAGRSAIFALLMVTTFLGAGCKDEDHSLIGTWQVTAAVFNPPVDTGGGTLIVDAYPILFPDSCLQDDVFIFEAKGVYIENEGATKCSPSDPQFIEGTYSESGSRLTTITDSATTIYNNTSVSEDVFTGTVVFAFSPTEVVPVDFTFTRQ